MEKSAVILGLSRQAKFLGLPMPYAMAVGAMTVLPFILFKPLWWFLTAPVWYGLARIATKVNPNAATCTAQTRFLAALRPVSSKN